MSVPVPGPPERSVVIGDGVKWAARWSGRLLLIGLAAVGLALLVGKLWSIVLPVLLALLVASVLEPPARFLERRLKFPPALAAGTTVGLSLVALVTVALAISPTVVSQSEDIAGAAQRGIQDLQDWVQEREFLTQGQIDAALQALQERIGESGSAIASGVLTGIGAATSVAVTAVITLILTFLILKDGRKFPPMLRRMAGERVGPHLVEVAGRSWSVLGGYIRTQAVVSAIDAVIIGAGLLIVGVPLAIPLAIITFAGGFIPIVGAFVAGALAVLVALVTVGPGGALAVALIVLAVQQLEGNVLSPWLQSKSMQLHSGVVLLSVTLASTLFGIVGAFLAVPLTAVGAVVVRYLDERVTAASGHDVQPSKEAQGIIGPAPPPQPSTTERVLERVRETVHRDKPDGADGADAPDAPEDGGR